MLKRFDLAKQFELVVKQEIINHNNEISQSNGRINEMEAKLLAMQAQQEIERSKRQSMKIDLCREHDTFSKDILEVCASLQSQINDIKNQLDSISSAMTGVNVRTEKNINALRFLDEKLKSLDNAYTNLSLKTQTDKVQMINEMSNLVKKHQEITEKTKEEILNMPCELRNPVHQLYSESEINKVDMDGFKKELEVLKKKFVIEKCHREYLFQHFGLINKGDK